jgi:AcrR family transcriptional regulator
VLAAAMELFAARGMDGTSMDSIAETSGVSKATIYKHWADKEALLLEVMAEAHGLYTRPNFDTGDIRRDVEAVLGYRPEEHAELRERLMPHLMAYSATHHEFGYAWRKLVMSPPGKELTHLLKLGMAKGELRTDADIDLALALLLGPIIYWNVFTGRSHEDPAALAKAVTDAFWRAFAVVRAAKRGAAKARR